MMRYLTTGFLFPILLILAAAPPAAAFPAEPEGFRGLPWGETTREGLDYLGDDPVSLDLIYRRNGDPMKLGPARLSSIRYLYNFMGEFYRVVISARSKTEFDAMVRHLTRTHKKPTRVSGDTSYQWKGPITRIDLSYDPQKGEVILVYTGLKVLERMLGGVDSALDALDKEAEEGTAPEGMWDDLFKK